MYNRLLPKLTHLHRFRNFVSRAVCLYTAWSPKFFQTAHLHPVLEEICLLPKLAHVEGKGWRRIMSDELGQDVIVSSALNDKLLNS